METAPANPKARADRVAELDGVRALAVGAVIVDHQLAFALPMPHAVSAFAYWLGLAGVRYFFVLSGFVITRRLLAEHAQTGTVSFGKFWLRRALRILPAFWVYLAAVALLGAAGFIRTNATSLGWSLAFLANVKPVGWFHEHIWTLSVEEQFYVVAPLAAWVLLGRRRIWSAVVLAGFFLGCLFWHRLEHLLGRLHAETSLEFLSMFRFIASGVALGVFAPDLGAWFRSLSGIWIGLAALATAVMRDMPVDHYWLKMALQLAQPVAIALVIGWVAAEAARCRWLAHPALLWIGRRSYSLYLWQQLFLAPAVHYLFLAGALFRWIAVPATVAASAASYAFVERPLLRFTPGRKAGGAHGPHALNDTASGLR
ncbi:MAG TPA: acyltransferase [Opitutaceae bacterium]